MTRTALIGAATAAAVVLTATPVGAATRVDGNHWATSGVTIARQGCFNPDSEPISPPRLVFKQDRRVPLGDRAVGWVMDGTGHGVGPGAHVADPSISGDATVRALFPTGYGQGLGVVTFHPTEDLGRWVGNAPLATRQTKRWQEISTAGLAYTWRHYTADGVLDATAESSALPAFVNAHGGDGDGAEVGFIFGCDGSKFYLDQLTVGLDPEPHTYNFEGYETRTALTTKGFRTITYGEQVHLASEVHHVADDAAAPGRVVLRTKPDGAADYRPAARKDLDGRGRTGFALSPARSTTLQTRYLGSSSVEGSESRLVRIKVSTAVRAGLVEARIVQGREFTITGRTLPRKAHTKVKLQRYVGKEWSTVRQDLTGGDGAFRIGTEMARLGRSYWRVIVVRAGGNEAGKSRWMKVTVVAPPPQPGDGGGDPGPPPTDPPPPPPDGPQRSQR